MHSFASLPKRRRMALGLNLILVAVLWVAFFFLVVNSWESESLVMLAIVFLSLPFVALFQYACVLYNLTQGSKIQFWYLVGSLVFLAFYIGSFYGFIDYFDSNNENLGIILLSVLPITCATIYCLVSYLDHPKNYPSKANHQDTLDGGLDLF